MGNFKIICLFFVLTFIGNRSVFAMLIDSAKIKRVQEFEKKSFYQFEQKLNSTLEGYFSNQAKEFSNQEFGFFSTYQKIFKYVFSSEEDLETYYAGLFKKYFKSVELQRVLQNEVQAFQSSIYRQREVLLKEIANSRFNSPPPNMSIQLEDVKIQSRAPIKRAENEMFIEVVGLAFELTPFIISSILIFFGFVSVPISSHFSIVATLLGLVIGVYFGLTANNKMETQLIKGYKHYLENNRINIANRLLSQQKDYYEYILQK